MEQITQKVTYIYVCMYIFIYPPLSFLNLLSSAQQPSHSLLMSFDAGLGLWKCTLSKQPQFFFSNYFLLVVLSFDGHPKSCAYLPYDPLSQSQPFRGVSWRCSLHTAPSSCCTEFMSSKLNVQSISWRWKGSFQREHWTPSSWAWPLAS